MSSRLRWRIMGLCGSNFRLSQFFQSIQGYSPLGSGIRILPWTIMPMLVAPLAGAYSDRIGGHRLMGIGLTLQAGGPASLAAISTPTVPYWRKSRVRVAEQPVHGETLAEAA